MRSIKVLYNKLPDGQQHIDSGETRFNDQWIILDDIKYGAQVKHLCYK